MDTTHIVCTNVRTNYVMMAILAMAWQTMCICWWICERRLCLCMTYVYCMCCVCVCPIQSFNRILAICVVCAQSFLFFFLSLRTISISIIKFANWCRYNSYVLLFFAPSLPCVYCIFLISITSAATISTVFFFFLHTVYASTEHNIHTNRNVHFDE